MKYCTWTDDGKTWLGSCGVASTEYPGDLEVCPGCGALCEYVAAEEVVEYDGTVKDFVEDFVEAYRHDELYKKTPVTPEWTSAIDPKCKEHHWQALGGLQDWYRCHVCGKDERLEFTAPTGYDCKHQWQYGFSGESRRCFSCGRNEPLNNLIKEGEASSGSQIKWKVPA